MRMMPSFGSQPVRQYSACFWHRIDERTQFMKRSRKVSGIYDSFDHDKDFLPRGAGIASLKIPKIGPIIVPTRSLCF